MKTYTEKMSTSGHTSYGVQNPIYYNDDVIDSVVYAYIAAQSYATVMPPTSPEEQTQRRLRPKFGYDKNHNIIIKNQGFHNKRKLPPF